ncbi:hypothetical protein [Paenarthrobacter ilicis]|uniref:hypothetical protein n=1 Tax=Paenarthrobacter ilicis TaxID=43665 RepID=UPI0028D60A6C|nr:hypothetical protein [Paenarthrobacter ilicis]
MKNEVETDTIGDWAGHTPQETASKEEGYTFTLKQRGSNEVRSHVLGLQPYILIIPQLDGDEEDVLVHVEVGGGAELEGIDQVFTSLGSLLGQPAAVQKIHDVTDAAKAKAGLG